MTLSVEKHLVAAQKFLTTVKTLSTFSDLEQKQSKGLFKALEKVALFSTGVAAGLLATLDSDLWSETTVEQFRQRVAEKTSHVEEDDSASRSQQDYIRLPYFLTEQLVAQVTHDSECDRQSLLDEICAHACSLGLRCPSERTMAVIVALAFWPKVRAGMTETDEYELLHQKKKRIKRNLGSVEDGKHYLMSLPATAAELPEQLQKAFPEGKVAEVKDWSFRVWQVALQWCCRGSNKAVAAAKAKKVSKDTSADRVDDILHAFAAAKDLTPRKKSRTSSGSSVGPTAPPAELPVLCDVPVGMNSGISSGSLAPIRGAKTLWLQSRSRNQSLRGADRTVERRPLWSSSCLLCVTWILRKINSAACDLRGSMRRRSQQPARLSRKLWLSNQA